MANRALEGAEQKGREARDRGEPRTACPYPDHRKDSGRLTFSRAFRNAWHHGWSDCDRELALADDRRQPRHGEMVTGGGEA